MSATVNNEHPLYKARKNLRGRIRDCMTGTDRVKSKTTRYLPLPDPVCNSANDDRYLSYLMGAYFINLPARTVRAFSGLVQRKEHEIELNSKLEYMLEDADGHGTSLQQMIGYGLDECETLGNFGILTKMPVANEVNKSNEDAFMPTLHIYDEEQIINWRVTDGKLSMVVLLEANEVPKDTDMFETMIVATYRALYIGEDGKLHEDLYKGQERDAIISAFYADDYYSGIVEYGDSWEVTQTTYTERTEIPFTFCGAISNEPGLDPSPIENICDFALKMYQVSADEMLNVHNASGGVLTISSSLMETEWKELNGSTDINVNFGAVHLGEGGAMSYVQASEATMINSVMERLMTLAVAQGAQVIMPNQQDKTATEAKIDQGANLSQLGQIAQNIGQAFTWSINMASRMINQPEDNRVRLNQEFFSEKLTPEEMKAWSELIMRGHATETDLRRDMRKGGRIDSDREDDDIDNELAEAQSDAGMVTAFDNAN
ncbi:portal protein [Vibrio phage 1.287.O._10N.286.55.C7]|nr:portal protein [Vibrio phage 1.287.O._10N.286.55.C7]